MAQTTRHYLLMYINGERVEVRGEEIFLDLATFLRRRRGLTGTKVVCAEGDCGACTVLIGRYQESQNLGLSYLHFEAINSCIAFLHALDLSHVITIEGIPDNGRLHAVQESFIKNHAAQCGYCTPGFICSIVGMVDALKGEGHRSISMKNMQSYLSGNLCRCTGHAPILHAASELNISKIARLSERYHDAHILNDFAANAPIPVDIEFGDQHLYLPVDLNEALKLKAEFPDIKMIAGATDLGVLINKDRYVPKALLSLQNVLEQYKVQDRHEDRNEFFEIGTRVTINRVEKIIGQAFPEFSKLLHFFASHQIKNMATLGGNLANASPVGDTIPFLMVAEAEIELASVRGRRSMNVNEFFLDYKKLNLAPDEIITGIKLAKPTKPTDSKDQFRLYKVSGRKDLDIATVTMAARFTIKDGIFEKFSLALGGVAPTVVRQRAIESFMQKKPWRPDTFIQASEMLATSIQPISDVRGSAEYRLLLCQNLLLKMGDVRPKWARHGGAVP
ncbi:MAG: FAD binding domain-containing protein [Bdellovibrio sp.]|nr:FAD binding domain-containing protein [Bdellovibrio sp.]